MKTKAIFLLFVILAWRSVPADGQDDAPRRIRIGVDTQIGFEATIDTWTPLAEYLTKAVPGYRFVIVPLASREDVSRVFERPGVDFTILNPALEVLCSDKYGTVTLATMWRTMPGEKEPLPGEAACAGAIIRAADRADLERIEDIRGQRVAAVKPWSLTGWLAQWGYLVKQQVDPYSDLEEVVFEGTQEQVIKNVLDGTADVGVVDMGLLTEMVENKRIPKESLYIFNKRGQTSPFVAGDEMATTVLYPQWAFVKAPTTPDELAQRVAEALQKEPVETEIDGMPFRVGWTFPRNYSRVRRLLVGLMGPQFAEMAGYPRAPDREPWIFPAVVIGSALLILAVVSMFVRDRYRKRAIVLSERLEETRSSLLEARAERQRVDAILAMAGCGIDIVDNNNDMVFADSSLERKYGDWHGRKCDEYYRGSDVPCDTCAIPGPGDEPRQEFVELNAEPWLVDADPHAHVHYIEGEKMRMIGIPFQDESGRWLYARVHVPVMEHHEKPTA
jgi:ABC-type phosphate/phosphonate transport system substrate-binding protein